MCLKGLLTFVDVVVCIKGDNREGSVVHSEEGVDDVGTEGGVDVVEGEAPPTRAVDGPGGHIAHHHLVMVSHRLA